MGRWNRTGMSVVGLIGGWCLAASLAEASCDRPTQGALCVSLPEKNGTVEVPLKHTKVEAEVSGLIASVQVTQTFTNPYEQPIEAIYVFPLPDSAAVNDMVMQVGDRTIRGLIKERREARKIYEAAKARGHVTGLLEQERPNIFTQSVANIEPGKDILITIRYLQDLRYDRGEYEFVFPMVVGPRYIPGEPTGQQAGGWSPDTDRVPDASRITPPVLKPGTRSGHDISVTVKLDAGVPIQGIHSTSHQVDIDQRDAHRAQITLRPSDTIPNKDLIVRYAVAGKRPEMALLAHRGDLGGYFLLMVQPQADFDLGEITPKEMIFVLDTSGSMSGEPIAKVKEAMRKALRAMNPNDTFQIVQFNSGLEIFPEQPMANTPENVHRGLSYINGIDARGGTQMLPGIEAALKAPKDPKRLRIVCLMTDGYIGNEREIFAAIQQHVETARVFAFGVGSSVNRYLVTQAAKLGRGDAHVIRQDEPTDAAVRRFYDRIARPYLTDIEIDWGSLDVRDLYPAAIPDLFAEQPVIVKGRYETPGSATIAIKGTIANREVTFTLPVTLPAHDTAHEALASLWARARIDALEDEQHRGEQADVVKDITELALTFRLMSQYTAFVAVEERSVIDTNGQLKTVQVPVEMPEGVSYEGVFGKDGARSEGYSATDSRLGSVARQGLQLAWANGPGRRETRGQLGVGAGAPADHSTALAAQPVPGFSLTLSTAGPDGKHRFLELQSSGELWLTERESSGTSTHRRLVRRLTRAQRRELWGLLDTSGMARGSNQRFGSATPVATLTLAVDGRTVTWEFGAQTEPAGPPIALQTLLDRLGASELLGMPQLIRTPSEPAQLLMYQPAR